jgi:hypothetical protein
VLGQEEAKRLLETFALVLPMDQLHHPQLDRILVETLGWAPGTVARHVKNQRQLHKKGSTFEELWGQELLSRLRNNTKEDQEVYQWARKRFIDAWGDADAPRDVGQLRPTSPGLPASPMTPR